MNESFLIYGHASRKSSNLILIISILMVRADRDARASGKNKGGGLVLLGLGLIDGVTPVILR